MLEQLHEIRWNALRDNYGPAHSVPKLLAALTQPDAQTREDAMGRLWLGLCYQRACLAEASAHAVPFLSELARSTRLEGRAAILELLQCMAEVSERPTRDVREAAIFEDTRHALRAELSNLLTLLADADAEVRARAALCAARLTQEDTKGRAVLASCLASAMPREPDAATRVAYVSALELLGENDALRAALDDRSPGVLMAAAFALLGVDPPEGRAYRIVKSSVDAPAQSARLYGPTAARYRPLDFIGRVCAAGIVVTRALLPQLLAMLADSVDGRADEDLAPLLALFFAHGLPLEPSLEQAAILSAVGQHRHYFGRGRNAVRLLEAHGLPSRPRLLRREGLRGPLAHLKLVPKSKEPGAARDVLAGLCQRELAGRSADELRSLHVVGVGSDALLGLLGSYPSLERLCLKSSDITARGLARLAHLPGLHTLELEDLELDREALRVLSSLPGLRELSLTDVTVETDPGELKRARPDLRLRVG